MTKRSDYPKVPNKRLAEIADLSESIADENQAKDGSTDLEGLLKKKGITVSYGHYDDAFCGMIECIDHRFHIYCNLNQVGMRNSGRARFTIAHELGHYFIDDHRQSLIGGVQLHGSNIDYHPRNPIEQEADCFASSLLMPEGQIRKLVKRSSGLTSIMAIQRRHKASVMASAARYCRLDAEPIAIVHWKSDKYGWKLLSTAIREANLRKTIEKINEIDDGSATSRAMKGEEPPACGYFETATSASRWFPYVGEASRTNVLLKEQAIRLGDHGVLTALTLQPGEQLSGGW